ncbi:uncharacterized protein LOC123667478 [Melitaea cinxia]|uniref:uncharacterized protein LOC123667478 n=1 Tax=Melitaea cinxia TaxID=113334 RepID=UPI001E270E31|nr:uncharacterized protein LOC123667478 [Melitaea cinxia]
MGWGAKLNHVSLCGQWSLEEAAYHSNKREMLAIWCVLKDHAPVLRNSTLLVQSDNKTVIAYLRNEGGTKSDALMNLCRKIFRILDCAKIHIECHYIPGRYNSEADHLSRSLARPEWHLLPEITEKIFALWGIPTIDLFASARAHVLTMTLEVWRCGGGLIA